MSPIQQRLLDRYAALDDGVDIFQVFWHPFEIVTLDGKDSDALREAGIRANQGDGVIGTNDAALSAAEEFLHAFVQKPGVHVADARTATKAWLAAERVRGDSTC
jgi:hypothetical protein